MKLYTTHYCDAKAAAGCTSCPSATLARVWAAGAYVEPFTPPDPLDPLGVDEPARATQQRRNLAIAIAAVLATSCDDVGG